MVDTFTEKTLEATRLFVICGFIYGVCSRCEILNSILRLFLVSYYLVIILRWLFGVAEILPITWNTVAAELIGIYVGENVGKYEIY